MNYRTIFALTISALLSLNASATFAGAAEERGAYQAKVKKAEALYKERCTAVAGEKIYKTVENVEGVLLMKVRPKRGDRELSNPMWPGAAFASEFREETYIKSFLMYEQRKGEARGHIDSRVTSYPGYRWVDVIDEKDGKRYRYTGSNKAVRKQDTSAYNVQLAMKKDPNYDLNVYEWRLDKSPAPKDMPRYGVTYEDHVIPEERDLWLASGTIKVIDLTTNEVLGELTRYAINYVHTPSAINPAPWLTSSICPSVQGTAHASTRIFVDSILFPAKEK